MLLELRDIKKTYYLGEVSSLEDTEFEANFDYVQTLGLKFYF